MPKSVGVTPMEYVVHVTGTHTAAGARERRRVPNAVRVLYACGILGWFLPLALMQYFKVNRMPTATIGWRSVGMLLAFGLAFLIHSMLWAAAFFYGRLVTSDQIAEEASSES